MGFSFPEFSVRLYELVDMLTDDENVIIDEDENVFISEVLKLKISEFCAFLRESDYYKSTLTNLNDFWNGDSPFYVKTVANVLRVIYEKMANAEDNFLMYLALCTHLPVLDECLKGV